MSSRRFPLPSSLLLLLCLALADPALAVTSGPGAPAAASTTSAAARAETPADETAGEPEPLELQTVELSERLDTVRRYLLEGDWLRAVQASRRFRQGLSWPDDLLGIDLAFEALAEQELGRQVESVCLRSMARTLHPALDDADFGELPTFDEPETVEIDETVTPPRPASIWRKAPVRPDEEPVVLRLVIDPEGKIAGITVQSGERSLVLRTLATICRATYHPATKNGEPVAVAITVRPADGPERVTD